MLKGFLVPAAPEAQAARFGGIWRGGMFDGYTQDIPAMAWGNAASHGIPIARTLDELIAIIRHLG